MEGAVDANRLLGGSDDLDVADGHLRVIAGLGLIRESGSSERERARKKKESACTSVLVSHTSETTQARDAGDAGKAGASAAQ